MGNLITVAAGFLLASQGLINFELFFATLAGLAFVIASACVFNNYIDRQVDKKMDRTKNRPLAQGLITKRNVLAFGIVLGVVGTAILSFYTNALTVLVASGGFFVYVVIYSMWKCRTAYATAIGSIAGALPPIVGYCAVSNRLDAGVFILFAILVLWQMPHFFSIAAYRLEDYTAAAIPVFPVKNGMHRTKVRMALYIVGFIVASVMLTLFEYTGYIYLTVATLLGLAWLVLCLRGFKSCNDRLWARNMFRLSLGVIIALCLIIPFDINV